jgi:MFS family permease
VIGFYTSGQFIGLALLTPVLSWLQAVTSWHWVFVATGVVGVVWGGIWYLKYREPRDSRANDAEIALIKEGGGLVDLDQNPTRAAVTRSDLATVLGHRKLWGIYLGQFCLTSTLWFFLTWFPTYLVEYRDMDYIKSGFLASLPFIAALVGVLFSGLFSDFLFKRGFSLGAARKGPIVTGLLLSTAMLGANFTDSTTLVIVFLSIAFFGNGWRRSRGLWCLHTGSDAPDRHYRRNVQLHRQPVVDRHTDNHRFDRHRRQLRTGIRLHDGHHRGRHRFVRLPRWTHRTRAGPPRRAGSGPLRRQVQ